jgi:hypothetical protein
MKSLHLAIDRVVVEGLPASGQRRFVRAVEERLRELARSGIAEAFARDTRSRIQSLSAGQLRPGATPDQAALQVVNSIRQSLGANSGNKALPGLGSSRSVGARGNV